jgi:perosamine synthetase
MTAIPVNIPRFAGNEKAYLAECIDTGWISSEGPFVQRLEAGMAALCGRRHAIAVSSGSTALDLAFQVLGLQPGDEVILPSCTIISCAAAIIRAGGVPVPCDVDPLHWNLTSEAVAAAITSRTRALLVVHIYGLSCDMEALSNLAREHGLLLVEDAAEAHGQSSRGRPCGGFGQLSIFSFYANKHIAAGEGGMVLCDDDGLAQRCRSLRNLAFGPVRFRHDELGWNYRLGNLQAAVAVAQLECLADTIARKRSVATRYSAGFADLPYLQLPLARTPWCDNHYWIYGIVLRSGCALDGAAAMARLGAQGIGTRPFFWPIHCQPALQRRIPAGSPPCPVSEMLAVRGFYIPSGPGMDEATQDRVIAALRSTLGAG